MEEKSVKRIKNFTCGVLAFLTAMSLSACSIQQKDTINYVDVISILSSNLEDYTASKGDVRSDVTIGDVPADSQTEEFDISTIPEYSGTPYYVVNDNTPYFNEDDLTTDSFEYYSDLDELGRCGVAYACVGQDLMPTEKRGDISSVKPTGWVQHKYDFVDGGHLYNRCHLIGYQLSGENANEKNLITGTRYLNVTGMLPFENLVADYVKETDEHVLYRVTPIFEGDNLVCSGILMEAESVEDEGDSVLYCVYVYNIQPGVEIDYATGENWAA